MSEKFDKRTIERKIQTGQVTLEEYNDYLASLPDDTENAEEVEAKFVYHSERKAAAES